MYIYAAIMSPSLQLTMSKKATEAPRILYEFKTAFILASNSAKSIVGTGMVGAMVGLLVDRGDGRCVGVSVGLRVVGSTVSAIVGNDVGSFVGF